MFYSKMRYFLGVGPSGEEFSLNKLQNKEATRRVFSGEDALRSSE